MMLRNQRNKIHRFEIRDPMAFFVKGIYWSRHKPCRFSRIYHGIPFTGIQSLEASMIWHQGFRYCLFFGFCKQTSQGHWRRLIETDSFNLLHINIYLHMYASGNFLIPELYNLCVELCNNMIIWYNMYIYIYTIQVLYMAENQNIDPLVPKHVEKTHLALRHVCNGAIDLVRVQNPQHAQA